MAKTALIEFILHHDGKSWIASRDGLAITSETLEELDQKISEYIKTNELAQGKIRVCMRFDMSTLPRWLHQYSTHYFNRTVSYLL